MYGLGKNEDLQMIAGSVLTQVCVGENEVILNFDKPVSITLLTDFSVSSNGGERVRHEDMRHGACSLLGLIGNEVKRVEVTDEGGLLIWLGIDTLELFDTSKEYESIWIKIGDRQIIV